MDYFVFSPFSVIYTDTTGNLDLPSKEIKDSMLVLLHDGIISW